MPATSDTGTAVAPAADRRPERVLETTQLVKAFGGLVAVNKVDFHASENEIVGLIGPNGAGKTTLFNAITGVYPPTSGTIRFQGRDIAGMLPSKVTKLGIARTFQNIRLFNEMTALENVMVGQHCRSHTNMLRVIARTPGAKRAEKAVRDKSMELIEYVGLSGTPASWPRTCPTARSGASRSPARWRPSRRCSSSTSRRRA